MLKKPARGMWSAALIAVQCAACSNEPRANETPVIATPPSAGTLATGSAGRSAAVTPTATVSTAGVSASGGRAAASGSAGSVAQNGAATTAAQGGMGASTTAVAGRASASDAGVAPAQGEDAGPTDPGAGTGVTIVADSTVARAMLKVGGANCAADRCSAPVPVDGQLTVELTVEHAEGGVMPVLVRWQGCGEPSTTFWAVTPMSTSYVLTYTSMFTGLRAGSTCKAEIAQGAWLVFAGDASLKVERGAAYCNLVQVSEMGVNAMCFPPASTPVVIQSDLPRWDCVRIGMDGMAKDETLMQKQLQIMGAANQLLSCTGAAR